MPAVLSDRDIKKLVCNVIRGANLNLINPNGIESRLGLSRPLHLNRRGS
jgi:hypothetical protein